MISKKQSTNKLRALGLISPMKILGERSVNEAKPLERLALLKLERTWFL